MFQSPNSVAQSIGYHIVGKKTYKSASADTHPPLGVVICESCVQFIFFSFHYKPKTVFGCHSDQKENTDRPGNLEDYLCDVSDLYAVCVMGILL